MKSSSLNYVKENTPIFAVILLAVLFRFMLPGTPPSLNWDEVSHGYNAYSILHTGADEWGVRLPLIFRAYGDYKLPLYIYITAVSEFFFGLNTFAVRLPSVLAGIGSVILTYSIFLELFRDKKANDRSMKLYASLAALLMAIEPWSYFVSRAALEANLSLFLFLAGFYCLLISVRKQIIFLPLSLFLFGLTLWTYNSCRLFTPMFLTVLLIINIKDLKGIFERHGKILVLSGIIFALFLVPMLKQLLSGEGSARYGWVQILDEGAIARLNEKRGLGGSRFVYNKPLYFAERFSVNYLSHFKPDFLFSKGGSNYQFNIPGKGLIDIFSCLFFYLGLIIVFKSAFIKKEKVYLLLSAWILLSPIPSAITREAPHTLRFITFLPIPIFLIILGLRSLTERFKKISIFIIVIYLMLLSGFTENYLLNYFNVYRVNYSQSWQYGYKEATEFARSNYNEFDKIIITKKYGEPHEFLLFNWPWDPGKYVKDPGLVRFHQSNWYWVDAFDKFYFVNDWQIRSGEKYKFTLESKNTVACDPAIYKCLLITSPGNYPEGWNLIGDTNFLDGTKAFEYYSNK